MGVLILAFLDLGVASGDLVKPSAGRIQDRRLGWISVWIENNEAQAAPQLVLNLWPLVKHAGHKINLHVVDRRVTLPVGVEKRLAAEGIEAVVNEDMKFLHDWTLEDRSEVAGKSLRSMLPVQQNELGVFATDA